MSELPRLAFDDHDPSSDSSNRRVHQRRSVAAMYSAVEAKPIGGFGPTASGHIYDVSLGGVRIDLDDPVAPGTDLRLALHLPAESKAIRVTGTVMRVFDADDDPICQRTGVRFVAFEDAADETRLRRFLGEDVVRAAA